MCEKHAHAAESSTEDEAVTECPVMPGSVVVKEEAELAGLVRDYEGKRYYLCCDSCGPLFDADPARYAHA
jgi:YHS domain-containing protein